MFIAPIDINFLYMANIKNPYSGAILSNRPKLGSIYGAANSLTSSPDSLSVPDPSKYLFGTKSREYQSELNRYNHLMSEREWDAQLALMDDERSYQEHIFNKYNSPSAQVAQMHDAGLNPDLQNISSDGFSPNPASTPTPNSPSMVSGETPLALDIFMMLPKVVSMVSSISSSFISNASANLSLDKKYEDMALQDALDMFTPDDIVDGVLQYDKSFPNNEQTPFDRRMFDFQSEGVSKRRQKRYFREFDNLVNGSSSRLVNAIYARHSSGASERSRFINFLGQYGFDLPDKEFATVIRDLNKITYETDKASGEYTQANIKSKAGTKFKSSGMSHIEQGHYFVGILEYFLGMLLDGQFHASRSFGPKGTTTSVGY